MSARESKLASLHMADSGFVFDPYTGLTYSLNETGAEILRWLRSGVAVADLGSRLAEEYDVPAATAEADAREFYDQLDNAGLLWTR